MTAIQRFTPLQRLLHWVVAVCILAMLFIGVGMVSSVEPKYLTLVSIHKPLGMAILVLALIRLVVRLRYGAPPLPADLPEPMKLAAYLSHYALYALMIAMPLIGWGMLSAAAYPVKLWDGVYLPQILPQSDSLHTALWNAHFYLAFLFFALVLMHIAAALFHALVRRDGVFEFHGAGAHPRVACPHPSPLPHSGRGGVASPSPACGRRWPASAGRMRVWAARARSGFQAHSPLRKTGVRPPSASTPSMSILSEPIIQSIWIMLLLPPRAAISSEVSLSPSIKHFA